MGITPMKRFEHGGDIWSHEGALDFSANLNPLGMPDRMRDVLQTSVDLFEAYPDPRCRKLIGRLSEVEGMDPDELCCTAGATDLIARVSHVVAQRSEGTPQALICSPCYSGYEQALVYEGFDIREHFLQEDDGFALTASILPELTQDLDLLTIASPNNPTGLCIERDLLVRVLNVARENGITVLLDACFAEFTDEPSAVLLAGNYPNLVIMKSFTKSRCMAGLRLGYGICSDRTLMADIRQAGQPWAVSTPAQLAGVAALEDPSYLIRTRAYVARERAFLADGLARLGLHPLPGQANYLMFRGTPTLYEDLLEQDILIRRCENYRGLEGGWYRIAIRTQAENEQLLKALRVVLEDEREGDAR